MITVTLTQDEVRERSQALAQYANKMIELEEEEEDVKAAHKSKMARLKERRLEISGEIRRLSRAVRLGVEERSEQQVLFEEEKRLEEFRQEARRQAEDRIAEGEELIERQQQAEMDEEERERLHREAVANWRREGPAGDFVDEIDAEIEEQRAAAAETEEEGEGFNPGFPPGFDPDRASAGLAQADEYDDGDGGTPFPTEYSEAEIDRIRGFYCADKIAYGMPVKICYVLGQPHIITGGGGGEVKAWPVLPIENVGEAGVFEYKDAPLAFTYQNMRVNCGSAKNPKWWVMVGPEIVFKVKQAKADDFTAPRCDECKRIDGGHTQEYSQSNALRFDDYLAYARAHYKSNYQSHARKMELSKLKDEEVRAWKRQQAGDGVEAEPEKKPKKRAKLSPVEAAIDR